MWDGSNAGGARVEVARMEEEGSGIAPASARIVEADEAGAFLLEELSWGSHGVRASLDNARAVAKVRLDPTYPLWELSLTLVEGAPLAGCVVDEDGLGVEGAGLWATKRVGAGVEYWGHKSPVRAVTDG